MTAILHILHSWGSPSETFVRSLVLGVPGARPVVVAHDLAGPVPDGLVVHTPGAVRRHLPEALAGKAAVLAAAAVAWRARVELVHAHFAHELLLADRTARLLHRPLIVSLHGRDLLVELDDRPDALEVVRRAEAVIVPSAFLARAARERGVADLRIAVIPSGVDLEEIPFHERAGGGAPPLVLFVGRFVEKKGVLDAARAVATVASRRALRARFVGTGPLREELLQALAPMADRAEVVDGTERSVVLRSLAEADLLISPSRTGLDGDAETLLLVNVEAQAAGIPVLTTDHGGIPSGLGPGAAVLVPEDDGPALVAALDELVQHPERWPAMGRAGRRHVEAHLTSGRTGRDTAVLYQAIIAGRPVPAALHPAGSRP